MALQMRALFYSAPPVCRVQSLPTFVSTLVGAFAELISLGPAITGDHDRHATDAMPAFPLIDPILVGEASGSRPVLSWRSVPLYANDICAAATNMADRMPHE